MQMNLLYGRSSPSLVIATAEMMLISSLVYKKLVLVNMELKGISSLLIRS